MILLNYLRCIICVVLGKALLSTLIFEGSSTDYKELQNLNALCPIFLVPAGILQIPSSIIYFLAILYLTIATNDFHNIYFNFIYNDIIDIYLSILPM